MSLNFGISELAIENILKIVTGNNPGFFRVHDPFQARKLKKPTFLQMDGVYNR